MGHHFTTLIKRILFITLSFFMCDTTQAQKTYFKVYVSYPFAGTPRLIKKDMKNAGFNNSTTVGFTQEYPRSAHYPSGALELGLQLKKNMSVSMEAGLEEAGEVHGYNTSKGGIDINFTNWFVQPKFNFHGNGVIFAVGPSVLFMNYQNPRNYPAEYDNSKVLPGIGLGVASASGKTKGFRFTVFSKINLHPTFDAETMVFNTNGSTYSFDTKINPTNLLVGFCFQF